MLTGKLYIILCLIGAYMSGQVGKVIGKQDQIQILRYVRVESKIMAVLVFYIITCHISMHPRLPPIQSMSCQYVQEPNPNQIRPAVTFCLAVDRTWGEIQQSFLPRPTRVASR